MTETRITRGHSCVPCQNRKIRCNGHAPCTYCIKTGKECIRPQRATTGRPAPPQSSLPVSGQVVGSGEARRYVEDNKLWTSLGRELDQKNTSEGDCSPLKEKKPPAPINLIFGHQGLDTTAMLHPSAVQTFRLWQVFLSNVHSLTKILHGPSMQEEILKALQDPSGMDASMEALLFSIYLIAVVSLTEEECHSLLDESREKHLFRYRYATETALSRVDFLRSTDLRVLQAFTLYLLSLRYLCDNDILWLLTGLATRMGQRMGLHRESSLKGLSPFETEMRRRVWWQIIILDGRAAQVTGASMNPSAYLLGDTKQPANVNDGDLVPSMSGPPSSSAITTEMVFCSVRIEIGTWMMQNKILPGFSTSREGTAKFLKDIDELKKTLEQKYLHSMDDDIPLNRLTIGLARSAICQLRLSVCHPMHRADRNNTPSLEEVDMLFSNSLEIIRYDIIAHTTPSLSSFLWHVSNFFPFEAFVLLISTLADRPGNPAAGTAWDTINQVYEHHPSFISGPSQALYWALGNLTLNAWDKAIASARRPESFLPAEPPCLARLRAERDGPVAREVRNDERRAVPPQFLPTQLVSRDNIPGTGVSDVWGQVQAGDSRTLYSSTEDADMSNAVDAGMDWEFWKLLLEENTAAVSNG
ncbi:fungal specific transcription factor domain-containing protein [Colletotrichum plurivorum]|uniref:Fungal specific transcription factor domain-containing protein n=1 Tax=Colletotrichum plurivorum TaxID=2175906 RepID=A0A8H6KQZ6_9PEZI|nr:fungal specific transcription factor domain-containing protein [Colletotrichum plurivorum]